jgi:hypothetical protein
MTTFVKIKHTLNQIVLYASPKVDLKAHVFGKA